MGYDICISRMNMEDGMNVNPISLKEWLKVAREDSELNLIERFEGINPLTGGKIYIENIVLWRHPEENYDVELNYSEGRILLYGYDDLIINKMNDIAKMLGANVIINE